MSGLTKRPANKGQAAAACAERSARPHPGPGPLPRLQCGTRRPGGSRRRSGGPPRSASTVCASSAPAPPARLGLGGRVARGSPLGRIIGDFLSSARSAAIGWPSAAGSAGSSATGAAGSSATGSGGSCTCAAWLLGSTSRLGLRGRLGLFRERSSLRLWLRLPQLLWLRGHGRRLRLDRVLGLGGRSGSGRDSPDLLERRLLGSAASAQAPARPVGAVLGGRLGRLLRSGLRLRCLQLERRDRHLRNLGHFELVTSSSAAGSSGRQTHLPLARPTSWAACLTLGKSIRESSVGVEPENGFSSARVPAGVSISGARLGLELGLDRGGEPEIGLGLGLGSGSGSGSGSDSNAGSG